MDEEAEIGVVEPDSDGVEESLDESVEVVSGEVLPALPVHSVRSETQGARGCWAVSNRTGEPCGAAARHGEDYCNAHAGVGVASDPASFAPLAHAARKENIRVRAEARLVLGNSRPTSPRGVLKAKAFAARERLADAAVQGALKDPRLALAVIREVDPPIEATVSVAMPATPEDVKGMSLRDLLALAKEHGIEPTQPLPSYD